MSVCQNYKISHKKVGKSYSPAEFRSLLEDFDLTKYSSVDLITPSHFSSLLIEALDGINLPIPIVWNSSGYEKKEMIEKLAKVVDVFMPDLKYYDEKLSLSYSKAKDYFALASEAICEMRNQKRKNIFKEGVLCSGVLIRHLVLPCCKEDSLRILDFIKEKIDEPFISLMCQFTPTPNSPIKRSLLPLEYKIVLAHAQKLGLSNGYIQDFDSSSEGFIPEF